MAAISSMIVELKDEIGDPERIIEGSTNQRMLFPDPATNVIKHQMVSGKRLNTAHVSHGSKVMEPRFGFSIPERCSLERTMLLCV